jgi:pyridoxamine 5'-phosphate oxidase family protein
MTVFTSAELEYLSAPGRLGRLATVDRRGAPQNSPVGHHVDPVTGVIDIYGRDMGASRKFRNLAHNDRVALVVDDVKSVRPWQVRGIEIRGRAEALTDQPVPDSLKSHVTADIIRVYPELIFSWGIDDAGMSRREVGEHRRETAV